MNINELQNEILKATRRLGELEAQNGEKKEVIFNDGGEEKYRTTTTNNQQEIVALRLKIMEMKKELEVRKTNKQAYFENREKDKLEQEHQSKEEKEQQELEENMRKATFKRVKGAYNAQSIFNKFINLVNGKKPNWSNIKNYTQEELDFLIYLSHGNTEFQKIRNDRRRDSYEGTLSFKEIEKKVNELNKNDFYSALAEYDSLQNKMELEELNGRHR